MRVCGIDGGQGGAVAIIDRTEDDNGKCKDIVQVYDVIFKKIEKNWVWDYDKSIEVIRTANDIHKIDRCFLEFAQALPYQGAMGGFHTGENYGFYKGVLRTLKIPFEIIGPVKWQHYCGIRRPKGDKEYNTKKAAAEVVLKRFPEIELYTKKNRLLDGRADAICIAMYGLENDYVGKGIKWALKQLKKEEMR